MVEAVWWRISPGSTVLAASLWRPVGRWILVAPRMGSLGIRKIGDLPQPVFGLQIPHLHL
jgi:hypothetical protein